MLQSPWHRSIGILGGMGASATVAFYDRIVTICQREYGAIDDADFPDIMILNLPLDDIVLAPQPIGRVRIQLDAGIRRLKQTGANVIAIPCNTAHIYLPPDPDILSIVDETVSTVIAGGSRSVLFLGTRAMIEVGLYAEPLMAAGIKLVVPSNGEIEVLTEVIRGVMAGKAAQFASMFAAVVERYAVQDLESILLACTELSLVARNGSLWTNTYDSLDILARATLREARCVVGRRSL